MVVFGIGQRILKPRSKLFLSQSYPLLADTVTILLNRWLKFIHAVSTQFSLTRSLLGTGYKYSQPNLLLSASRPETKFINVLTPPLNKSRKHRRLRQNWLNRRIRLIYLKLLRLRGNPKVVAKGLAVGVFAGCFPFFGIQSLIGLFLATIVRGSRVAALAATWISNPLTYVPLYIFNYKIGKLLLGTEDTVLPTLDIESFTAFKELGSVFAITLLTGSFVVGMILAIVTYFYGLAILERLHSRRVKRRKIKRKQ